MTATRSPGQTLWDGTRYAMAGDRYMTPAEIGDAAEVLFTEARDFGRTDWLTEAALRMQHAEPGTSTTEAAMILAAAHVTWSDICRMKS